MGGLTLLDRARAAGLSFTADGDRLIIRGPRSAETVARELLARKPEVLELLATPPPAATVAADTAGVQPDLSGCPPAVDARPAEETPAPDTGQAADPLDALTVCHRTPRGWRWSDPDAPPIELFDVEPEPRCWRCLNPYCRHKGRWWKSVHGVVNCLNCRPPSFPWLVTEEGDADNAPHSF
jgi:hypothetical protein